MRAKLESKAAAIGGKAYLFCDKPISFTGMRPVALLVGEREYPVKNWRDLITKTCDELAANRMSLLLERVEVFVTSYLSKSPDAMRAPYRHVPSGLYIETNCDAQSHLRHSRELFEKCKYDTSTIGLVYVEGGLDDVSHDNGHRRRMPPSNRTIPYEEIEDIEEFDSDLMANYPNGFDFKDTSLRLIEQRLGKKMSDSVCDFFHFAMFERTDGLWLFCKMVIDRDKLDLLVARAKELLECEGSFALDSLRLEFSGILRNIETGTDFKRFFNKYIVEKIGGKVRGHEGWRVCFKLDASEEEGWTAIASRVRDVLVAAGDSVSIEDILSQLPHLNREVILRVCQDNLKDAIAFSLNDIEYVKLLEAYYLPDDFGEALASFVTETECNNGIVSIVMLEAELNAKYGDGFRVNFSLEDDDVFKQVISASYSGDTHDWKKDMFVCETRRAEANVAEAFLQTHIGVFHEEEFFRFALESRGMANRGMLILAFLRKYCVRLSKEWWISKRGFEEKVHLSKDDYSRIGDVLNSSLGNNAFKPLSMLPNSLFENFPRLEFDGKEIEWNHYLLTSISVWKIKNAHIVNDEPSPYTVTAMIVPIVAGDVPDVVSYVLRAFPFGYFKDADAAFDYLKSNNIRMTKTGKLVARINEILKVD